MLQSSLCVACEPFKSLNTPAITRLWQEPLQRASTILRLIQLPRAKIRLTNIQQSTIQPQTDQGLNLERCNTSAQH